MKTSVIKNENRAKAVKAGLTTYLGSPCRNCKKEIRWTSNSACVACQNSAAKRKPRFKNSRAHRLKFLYGLSSTEFFQLLEKQNYCCAICNINNNKRKLVVDHCHKTSKVRGLLCQHCNSAIGFVADDISLLEKAIEYLRCL